MFDDDFGKLKMEQFKELCRNVLGEKKKVPNNAGMARPN
jgi:hypothetical protein